MNDNELIKFYNKLKKPWTFDGERYLKKDDYYDIRINKNITLTLDMIIHF